MRKKGDIDGAQLTSRDQKLQRVQDLGEWWRLGTGLPLLLGGSAIRRGLNGKTASACCAVLRDTGQYAQAHAIACGLGGDVHVVEEGTEPSPLCRRLPVCAVSG